MRKFDDSLKHFDSDIKTRADIVRSIALEEVLKRTGSFRHRYDKAKWHSPRGVLSVRGEKFFNWAAGVGGGGAISLVIHLMEYDFKSSVNWLSHNFSSSGTSGTGTTNLQEIDRRVSVRRVRREDSEILKLPQKDDHRLPKIIQYLTHQRCLPKAVIHELIRRGILYADDKGNAVFLLLGKEKRVVGAEIRGTNDNLRKWHGIASGSKKELGCFYLRSRGAKKVVLCESAIDAISYFVLHSNCMAVSTAGANPTPPWLSTLIDKGFEIFCAFDSDRTGDTMAYKMITLYPVVKRLRPEKHDWNEVLQEMRR
jgi:hypothetical protein